MSKPRVGIIFWHRTDKVNKQGLAPISCRLTHNGRHTEVSTGIRLAPADWGGAHRRVLGRSEAAKRANSYLLQMHNDLEDVIADLARQGKPVTAQTVARRYRSGNAPSITLAGLYAAFLAERGALVGVELAPGTLKSNAVCYNRLMDFLTASGLSALLAEEFTHNLADKLLYWLIGERGFKRNSANKVLTRLSQVLRWGVRREYLTKNPLDLYRCKGQESKGIKYLSEGELAALTTLVLPTESLAMVRDCFVFQCWTGLAYADVAALNIARDVEYHRDKTGSVRRVLRIRRAKSTLFKGYECVIPLLPEAERLLAHYEDALPVLTNQAYNRLLKVLGELCGIAAEKMTTHVGRKTAGTLLLNMGVPLPVVSKFLGHANVLITQKLYAELLDTTVIDAFATLGGYAPAVKGTELTAFQPAA